MTPWRPFAYAMLAICGAAISIGAGVACRGPATRSPRAAAIYYRNALAGDNPQAAYALLADAVQQRTPYREFAERWKSQAPERAAQLASLTADLARPLSPLLLAHAATITSSADDASNGATQRAQFVKHGDHWYVDTPLLAATFYATPESAIAALRDALDAPAVQTLIGIWTADRQIELAQQLAIAKTGLTAALAAGTRASQLSEDRAQFSFYGGDLWFLITLARENDQWHVENIYSDNGLYPMP